MKIILRVDNLDVFRFKKQESKVDKRQERLGIISVVIAVFIITFNITLNINSLMTVYR